MKNLLILTIALLLAFTGCDKIFTDKNSKNDSKSEQQEPADTKKEDSDYLTRKDEELKKKELELKEEELKMKEEELQRRKQLKDETPQTKRRSNYGIPGDYPEASLRYLTYSDVEGKSKWELSVMRNEIYARHGFIFQKNVAIKNHFMKKKWYNPQYYNVEHLLSDIERYNIAYIKSFE